MNPTGQYTLAIRGYKLNQIENLGVTRDVYSCIDLSDNEIRALKNFDNLKELETIFLNSNLINKIEKLNLKKLKSLYLSDNRINSFSSLIAVRDSPGIERLSLLNNPVTENENYKKFILSLLPNLKFLDFQKIIESDRIAAREFAKSEEGKKLLAVEVEREEDAEGPIEKEPKRVKMDDAMMRRVKEALINAEDLELVNRLEKVLESGNVTDEILKELGI